MYGIKREAFAPLSTQRKICLVLAVWLVSMGTLCFLNRNQNLIVRMDCADALETICLQKNRMGRCQFGLVHPADKRALGTVSFESLSTSSADTGPFKTAALRQMDICRLSIELSDSLASPAAVVGAAGQSCASAACESIQTFIQTLYSRRPDQQDLMRIALPDISHLIHISVTDFQCRFLEGPNIALHIESKKASVQADKNNSLLLRGHVLVRTPAGTLESNRMLWDVENQTFRVQGFYSMRTGDELERGIDGYFDTRLNKITPQKTFANKGE